MANLIEDELIAGAIDLHAHGYPEVNLEFRGRMSDTQWAQAARAMNMGGFVMKSHVWPTMERAESLREQFPDLKVYGGITLNLNVGGLSPWSVESAIRLGAKALWLPTWSARFDIEHHRGKYFRNQLPFYQQLTPEKGLSVCEEGGGPRSEVKDIIDLAHGADLIVGTGHISPRESLALADYCRAVKFKKLVFTHPLSLGATLAEIAQMAAMGFYIEITGLHVLLQVVQIPQVLEVIQKVGPERCLLTTDAFFSWVPPAPEMLRLLAGILHHFGLKPQALRQMIFHNPRDLLGLAP